MPNPVVESTSASASANMVENPLAELLELLEITEPSLLLWLSAAELETAMEGKPLSKKVQLRRTFFTYIDARNTSNQASHHHHRGTTNNQQTASPSNTTPSVVICPQGSSQAPPSTGQHRPFDNDITNVAYWCDMTNNYEHEKSLDSTKAISAVAHLKCPDNEPYKGNSDARSINYFLSIIRCEAKQTALGPRLCFVYLSNCLNQSVKRKLQVYLENNMDPLLYPKDYILTLSLSLCYLQQKYSLSNSHSEVLRYFTEVAMDDGDNDIYGYLDRIESAVTMCESVGLHLQPSQINEHYREGLNSTLKCTASQNYSAIEDIQQLTQSLRSHIRCNPNIYNPNKTTNIHNNPTRATTATAPPQASKPKVQRVEDPALVKLCREQGVCLAWTARKQCRYAENCKYKHSEVARFLLQSDNDYNLTPGSDMVLRSVFCADHNFSIVADTGCTKSVVSWKLAIALLQHYPDGQLIPSKTSFDTATAAGSMTSLYQLKIKFPVCDDNGKVSTLTWSPAIINDGLLLHSDGLLGMDALNFNADGLLLTINDTPTQASRYLCSSHTLHKYQSSNLTPTSPASTSTTSKPTEESTVSTPRTPTSGTTTLDECSREGHHISALKGNTTNETHDISYNIDILGNSPPSFPQPPEGYQLLKTIYNNEWCTIGVLLNDQGNKEYYVDYSDQLLQLALDNQPKPVPPTHYFLMKASADERRQAEERIDALITEGKLQTTAPDDVNNYTTNWYPRAGRKRVRPIQPTIRTNDLVKKAINKYPIKDCQSKIPRIINKYRSSVTAHAMDIRDAYRAIKLGRNLQLLSQINYKNKNWTYTYMSDGNSTNPQVLEIIIAHAIGEFERLGSCSGVLVSYMDDFLYLGGRLEDIKKVVDHFANYGMHLTTDSLHGPEANGLLVLGHELCNNGDSLLLPTNKYNDAINFDLTTDVSYKKALSLLNTLWQAWDLLPWHTLIVKNCLTALVSRLRAVKDRKWTDNIDHKTLDMLQRWQQSLKANPPTPVHRYVDTDTPIHVWFDSSDLLGSMVATQNDQVVFRKQWRWTPQERAIHINVKELTTAYNALSTLVSFELDIGRQFSKIILYGDNRTANSALASGKVSSSGKQSTLLQRTIDLIQYLMGKRQYDIHYVASLDNPADSGTRSELYADVVNYRDIIDGRKYETIAADDSNDTDTVHVARVIRKRDDDDDYDDNENPNKVPRLERPLQVPKNPLSPLEKPPYFDIIQLPPDLLHIYRALPLGDDGRRRVSDDDFIYECAEFCHSLKHTGAPGITATLNCYFDPKSATTDFDHAAKKASRSCVTCALVKTDPGDRQPKNPTPADTVIPDRPFQVASLDILGPYITTTTSSGSTGKYYSINLVCQLTNMLLCHPTVNAPASIDVQRAANLPHRLYHYPLQRILTDNASIIKSASNSMPSVHFDYVPVSASWLNGHVEARHRLLNQRLRRSFLTTALFDDKTWFDAVSRSAYEINSSSNLLAHGLSPLDMVIDGSGTSPFDTSEKCKLPDEKWSIWRKYKTDCRERTLKAMAKKTSNGPPLEIGDSVLVHTSEPHAKATTPWMPTRRIILEIDGNRALLDNGLWRSTDKLKKLPDEVLPRYLFNSAPLLFSV